MSGGGVIWSGSNRIFFPPRYRSPRRLYMGDQTDFIFSLLGNRNQYVQKATSLDKKNPLKKP